MINNSPVNFVYLTAQQYADLESYDDTTVYFIESAVERRIAIGEVPFGNYIEAHCTSLTLSASECELATGDSIVISAITTPDSPSDPVTWTASNSNITITATSASNKKLITGVSEGSAVLTVTCGEFTQTCEFSVHEPYVYTEHILAENYNPNGSKFKYTAPISLDNGNYIEISIDTSTVTGTKENILSVGQNIDVWQGTTAGSHMHMYLTASNPNDLSVDLIYNSKTMRPTYTMPSSTLVVKIDKSGVYLNGAIFLFDTRPRVTPTITYAEDIQHFVSLNSYDIGSQEGSNRSHATYNYIKYFTTS